MFSGRAWSGQQTVLCLVGERRVVSWYCVWQNVELLDAAFSGGVAMMANFVHKVCKEGSVTLQNTTLHGSIYLYKL